MKQLAKLRQQRLRCVKIHERGESRNKQRRQNARPSRPGCRRHRRPLFQGTANLSQTRFNGSIHNKIAPILPSHWQNILAPHDGASQYHPIFRLFAQPS
jgi:hypothetical protein